MLRDMLQAFGQYKLLTVLLILAVVLAVFMVTIASRAVRRHNRARDAILQRYKQEDLLRRKYAVLTPDLVQSADARELLQGVGLCLQRELENEKDMNAAFSALSEPRQSVYALYYLLCEDCNTLSEFFRAYGQPMTGASLRAAQAVFPEQALNIFTTAYKMFDESDETTSCTKDSVQNVDQAFNALDRQSLFQSVRHYIIQNIQDF